VVIPVTRQADVPEARKDWGFSLRLVVPGVYCLCSLVFCLCHLMAPGYTHSCLLLLVPLWTLGIALHAIGMRDLAWLCLGLLTGLLLPFALLVSEVIFAAFYLVVFTVFASGRFWLTLSGVPFILVSLSWFGLASSLILSAVLRDQPLVQLAVAGFFALVAASVTASKLPRLTLLLT
jgi:hypothetical protein